MTFTAVADVTATPWKVGIRRPLWWNDAVPQIFLTYVPNIKKFEQKNSPADVSLELQLLNRF